MPGILRVFGSWQMICMTGRPDAGGDIQNLFGPSQSLAVEVESAEMLSNVMGD